MRYTLLVTGPAYGTQQASSALLFAHSLLKIGHHLESVFFYSEGVLNANHFNTPANDEIDIVRMWQKLNQENGTLLNVCVAAALRRGVISQEESINLKLKSSNLQKGFKLCGLGVLAVSTLSCDRLVQF
ncbi:sulfurtransferase complex subunit TusD [Candidatus Pantoea carbekii]|uniref:Sulfurtransferase TusD n=1 Tax=Candidatus Pantoea carbekii TaxID=1235990 RepID=U3U770_9GAMM|nr:sulfurtransferase complex subunit TusD [Candidatus Pantoea carbekii]AKC32464.1 DsrE_DsrF-like sulfur reduction protein [Candidatus Pantoea carbekii]BAO00192.1 sulfur transfer complex subunit TusD [Candidatus Pantoea carbekii]